MAGRGWGWVAFGVALAVGGGEWGQDPMKTLPENYRLVFENDRVRVIRAHYGPREKVPVHDHPSVATVFVYLNDSGEVRIKHEEESTFAVVRPATKLGSYRVAPGLAERHSIENLGEVSSDFLRVEMKNVTLGIKEPFRGKAFAGPLRDEDVVEFNDPAARVERIVCAASPCGVKAEGAGSLVVAFGAVSVAGKQVDAGGVFWVGAGESEGVRGEGGVHLLRVVLPLSKA